MIDPDSGHVEQTMELSDNIQQVTDMGNTLLLLTDKELKAYDMNTGESVEADKTLSDQLLKDLESEQKKLRNSVVVWVWERGRYAVLLCRERYLQTCFWRYRGGTGGQWKSCFHRKSQSYAHISGSYGG